MPKIKGSHTAMKSGMVAAEAVFRRLAGDEAADVRGALEESWVWPELRAVRNIRPSFRRGLWAGLAYAALDTYVLRGAAPWTFHNHADHTALHAGEARRGRSTIPSPTAAVTFDRLSSVFISNTNHEENQPPHLRLRDPAEGDHGQLSALRFARTALLSGRRLRDRAAGRGRPPPILQINAQNCVHCKTCDIKDPTQNIDWVVPEGGGGPNYPNM